MSLYVAKNDRIRARWLEAQPKASLAGVQFKVSATEREVVGVVKRIRGDRPVDPTEAIFFVLPDGETDEVPIRPEWSVEVIKT